MKNFIFSFVSLMTLSAAAATLECHADGSKSACTDLYEVFMADDVCFSGDVTDATNFYRLGLKQADGIRFLEGQVAGPNRMLVFVKESGVEQLRYIPRCQ